MSTQAFFDFFDPRKNRDKMYYSLLFIGFGVLITLLTSYATYRIHILDLKSGLTRDAALELKNKQEQMSSFITGLTDYVNAVRTSAALLDYIDNPLPENRIRAVDLLDVMIRANPDVMQLRYLDEKGMEILRVDQDFGGAKPIFVDREKLQDKSHRYYFLETAALGPNSYWFSNLDLNVEQKQIEEPHKPVFRVAAPVHRQETFKGIVIANIHAREVLQQLIHSNTFNISLLDRDGFYIVSHNPRLSWSRYLQSGHSIQQSFPEIGQTLLAGPVPSTLMQYGEFFGASIASLLPRDGAILFMEPKKDKIDSLEAERRKAAIFIVLIIFLLSLPLSYIISIFPARLMQKIQEQNNTLTKNFSLIDSNILSCRTDTTGRFLEVSTAFAETTGYTKRQLIDSDYSILYPAGGETDGYLEMWHEIAAGSIWQGELPHLSGEGKTFWTETTVYPEKDAIGSIISFSFIHQDVSDKKRIEELSVTDDLTGLYNRRFFNKMIGAELLRAQRDGKQLSFAMLDIDFFKQYNDTYGHLKGDEVLKTVSLTLKKMLSRGSDSCFRLGGEEFGILFIDHTVEEAVHFVDEIRAAIHKIGIEHRRSKTAKTVTISAGLISVRPGPGVSVDVIYRKADEALYLAKNKGRNRVERAVIDSAV